MEKLDGKSMNIIAENISKIKELFPEVFCDDKIDFERLQEVLGEYTDDKEERYSFNWKGKSKAIKIAQTPSTGTLRPAKEESKSWDTTENLYIEGDNLEVLKLLQKTYNGKVKMIYIDPPYNTGKDFIYPDNYRDNIKNYFEITGQVDSEGRKVGTNSEASGRYHTDWLNMMYPRLRLARNLLSDDGVILVSIGDNELSNLLSIMNEIFGETNQICIFTWKSRAKPTNAGNSKFRPQKVTEYIVVYGRKPLEQLIFNVITSKSRVYPHEDEFGKYRITTILTSNRGSFRRETMRFESNGYKPDDDYRWKAGKVVIDNLYATSHMQINESGVPQEKKYEHEEQEPLYPIYSLLDSELSGTAEIGKSDLNSILGNNHGFDTVKPVQLIKYLVATFVGKQGVVVDFFSGTATTAQAVFEYNLENKTSITTICVQLPESIDDGDAKKAGYKNICEIGKDRIRKSGDKILEENKDKDGIENLDIGFKVFKLDSSNIKKWDVDGENLEISIDNMIDNFVDNRTEEDIVYEIMLKYGIDLTYPVEMVKIADKKVFSIGFGALFICLDNEITLEVIEGIVKLKDKIKPEVTRAVFKDNGFKNDSVKTNAIQILRRNKIQEIMSI